jgi:hypothetical protein
MNARIRTSLTTLISAALLSCLIWIYADQITTESARRTLRVKFKAATPDLIITSPETQQFELTIAGSHAQLEKLRKKLEDLKSQLSYEVKSDDPTAAAVVKDGREIVEEILRPYGVFSVSEVSPAKVEIGVDRYIEVSLPVKVETGLVQTTEPVVAPPSVKVRLAKSFFEQLDINERVIKLDLKNELSSRQEKDDINEDFSLPQMLNNQRISTDPARVRVRLRITRQMLGQTFPSVSVGLICLPEMMGTYKVEIAPREVVVAVLGPADQIPTLTPQDIKAFVRVEPDDVERGPFPRDVEFVLPAGITLDLKKMDTHPSVIITLTRISAEEKPAL